VPSVVENGVLAKGGKGGDGEFSEGTNGGGNSDLSRRPSCPIVTGKENENKTREGFWGIGTKTPPLPKLVGQRGQALLQGEGNLSSHGWGDCGERPEPPLL